MTATHVWWWRKVLPDRKGQLCAVLVRGLTGGGRVGNIGVQFQDGTVVVTSRWAVRLVKGGGNG